MADRTLVVVTAGLGQPSATRLLADRLAEATARQLRTAGLAADVRVVELRDHARALADHLVTGFPSPDLKATIQAVLDADGLVAVSPIFSASYSGLFKLFFDVIERDALDGRPVLVAATGGTARHSLALDHALRPLFAYLGALVMPTGVFAASEDWGTGDSPTDRGLAERIERAAAELAAAVVAHEPASARDPFADPVPFETLLRGPAGD